MSVLATASVLGKTPKTFRSWIAKGLIPPPIYEGLDRPDYKFYTVDEVQALVDTLKGTSDTSRFLKAGTQVVKDLHNAIANVRSK